MRKDRWDTVRIVLFSKLALFLVTITGYFLEFNLSQYNSAYAHWPDSDLPTFSSRLATWDSAHYLILSEQGYRRGSPSCAFYPLWPALIHLASAVSLGHPVFASLLLANILSVAALWMFREMVSASWGPQIGRDALILLLACPGAFFFSFSYTESLFFFMVMVFFRFLSQEKYLWPVAMAFLMPLTKAIGVFMVVPLAWHLWERNKPLKYGLFLGAPILGYLAYFGIMYGYTGNAFEGFEAQKAYPNSPSIMNMFNISGLYSSFVNLGSFDGMKDSFLDRFCFILFLVMLPAAWRLNRTWFWYTLAAGMIPALTSWFMSYRRYFLVCFPLFIVMALLNQKGRNRWVFWYYVVIMTFVQVCAVLQFLNFSWAG